MLFLLREYPARTDALHCETVVPSLLPLGSPGGFYFSMPDQFKYQCSFRRTNSMVRK